MKAFFIIFLYFLFDRETYYILHSDTLSLIYVSLSKFFAVFVILMALIKQFNKNTLKVMAKAYVDEIVAIFKKLWSYMNISYDRYIRTTDDYHVETVQKIFKDLYDRGYIYKGEYKGKYCTPCESFWTESQLVDGKCPECGRAVTEAAEEAYFFKLSPFADRIEKLLLETDYLQPKSRAVELVNNFIKPGLEDLCVSRTSFTWGIPVTFDPGHVVYVWVDALSNYISALGYLNDKYDDFDRYWPADVHMVAKDIMRFHAIIWPAMLMALDLPLPKHLTPTSLTIWATWCPAPWLWQKNTLAAPCRNAEKQTKNWTPLSLTRHWSCGIKWLPTWTRPS